MASSKEYLDFVLEQLSELDDITYRAMMSEYIIYYRGQVIGGIYDDRFLVKPTKSAESMLRYTDIRQRHLTSRSGIISKNLMRIFAPS